MADAILSTWKRPHYRGPGGKPFLFYVVFGSFGALPAISRREYRSSGLFSGLKLSQYSRSKDPEALAGFLEGYLWNEFCERDPALAQRVRISGQCLVLRGELEDQPDLNYLRDSVGLVTFLLDHGGVTVFDPLSFTWWSPSVWKERVFQPDAPVPRHHVIILTSAEESVVSSEAGTWFHTRGMRKFGRPDLSIHRVPAQYRDRMIDLCERFIELQALGGTIEEGQEIRVRGLPTRMTCHHEGHLDDPDFNNVHVSITPPSGGWA